MDRGMRLEGYDIFSNLRGAEDDGAGENQDQQNENPDNQDNYDELKGALDKERKTNRSVTKSVNNLTKENQELQERLKAFEEAEAARTEKETVELSEKAKGMISRRDKDNAALQARYDALAAVTSRNILETAILKDTAHKWHDLDLVIKSLDSDDYEVDLEKGDVVGLQSALEGLAKDKPFLVKPDESGPQRQVSGVHLNGGTQDKGRTDEQIRRDLESRYPALRK